MHPAPSIIVFTALSGLGFGLMFWLGLAPHSGWVMGVFSFIAMGLAVVGLLASTFHLGHPERAIKAFSQWRSSWLSREGVVSVAALIVFGAYAGLIVLFDTPVAPLGWLAAALSLLTVYCTSMIYAQLKSVPRWNTPLTPALFLAYGLTGGALLAGKITVAAVLLVVLSALQVAYWMTGDTALARSGTNRETATGLGNLGKVRLLEPPHTGGNYLLTEMAYKVGRKHAQKLRFLGALLVVVVPFILAVLTEPHHFLGAVIVLSHIVGLFITRWLFFAEAEHVVSLYYGRN